VSLSKTASIQPLGSAFGVPGESYLPVLDALYARRDDIALTINRHESGPRSWLRPMAN
jgi:hypothetical protein